MGSVRRRSISGRRSSVDLKCPRCGGCAAADTGSGERSAEEAAGGSDAGQRGAEGHRRKKMVTPAARRSAVTVAREAHGISGAAGEAGKGSVGAADGKP